MVHFLQKEPNEQNIHNHFPLKMLFQVVELLNQASLLQKEAQKITNLKKV